MQKGSFSLKKKKKGSVIRVGCLSQSLLSAPNSREKVRPSSAHPTVVLTSILGWEDFHRVTPGTTRRDAQVALTKGYAQLWFYLDSWKST